MSGEPPIRDRGSNLKELWQDQKLEGGRMAIEEIRGKAGAFERKIRWRNAIEYVAAIIVVVNFTFQAIHGENVFLQTGSALFVMAAVYVVYSLHRGGSAQSMPDELGRTAALDFHRAALTRQRDLLLSIWRWYLLPFVPGFVLTLVGFAVRDGVLLIMVSSPDQKWKGLGILFGAALMVGLFFFIAALNKRAARKLQSEIDSLQE